MYRVWAFLLLGGLVVVAGGCDGGLGRVGEGNQPAAAAGQDGQQLSGVAVIDLDEVACCLGSDVAMAQALRDSQASLNQQLQSLQASLQQEYLKKKDELDTALASGMQEPAAGAQQLEALGQQVNLQLDQAWREANDQISAHKRRLVQDFREEVKPVAQEVAAQRGLGVVVTRNESVLLSFDQQHDITGAVVERLLAGRAALQGTAPPAVARHPAQPGTSRR